MPSRTFDGRPLGRRAPVAPARSGGAWPPCPSSEASSPGFCRSDHAARIFLSSLLAAFGPIPRVLVNSAKSGSGSQKVQGQHPVPERQARAVHRGSRSHGKVLPARRAAVWRGPFVRNRGRARAPALGAPPGPPPADALQPVARGSFVLIGLRPDRHARPPARASPGSGDAAGSLAKGRKMRSPGARALLRKPFRRDAAGNSRDPAMAADLPSPVPRRRGYGTGQRQKNVINSRAR